MDDIGSREVHSPMGRKMTSLTSKLRAPRPGHTLKPVDHDNKETRLVPVNGLKEIRLRAAVFRNFLGLTLSIGK